MAMTVDVSTEEAPPSKDSGWRIRRYRSGDEAGIRDLFQRVFDQDRSLQDWKWKFVSGPYSRLSFIHLAHVGERIVGQYAGVSTQFSWKGREIFAVQPVDNMIDPEYRKGLGSSRMQKAMYEDGESACREAGISFGYGFPNEEAYRVGRKVLGYQDLGPIHVRSRSLTWGRHARRILGRGRTSDLLAKGQAAIHGRLLALRAPRIQGVCIKQTDRFDQRFDRLWNRAAPSFGMLAVRDQRYLSWRYTERPNGSCTIFTLEKGAELLGYIVLGNREGGVRTGLVADLFTIPEREVAETLLLASLRFFLRQGFDLAECWSPAGGPYETLIQRFFPRQRTDPVRAVVKVLDPSMEPEGIFDLRNWHITMGDADGV